LGLHQVSGFSVSAIPGVEQHGTLALELAKAADALGEETRERQKDHKVLVEDG